MDAFVQILQQALLGGAVGYGTNWLAIRLLFRPYERVKVGPFSFGPGVFVRHQENLAREVARIAAESILTVDTLKENLASAELREYFEDKLESYLRAKADEEWGPPAELVPEELRREYRELVLYARGRLREEVDRFIESEEFARAVEGAVTDVLEHHGRRRLGEVLDGETRGKLARALQRVLVWRLTDPAMEERVVGFFAATVERFLGNERPLRELLPPGVAREVDALARDLIRTVLPGALNEADFRPLAEEVRALLKRSVAEFLDTESGSFFKRLVNRTINYMKGEQVEEALNRFADGLPGWLVEHLSSPEGAEHLERMWGGVLKSALDMSPAQLAARLDEGTREALAEGVGRAFASLMRSEEVSEAAAEYLESVFSEMKEESLEDVLRAAGEEEPREAYAAAARFVLARMRERGAKDRLAGRLSQLLRGFLDKPLGRLSRFLPAEAIAAVAGLLNGAIFDYMAEHSAQLVRSLEIERTIREKIAGWDPRELHAMVERAARENLRRLEVLGGLIGLAVGAAFGAARLLF